MKKILIVLTVLLMGMGLIACGSKNNVKITPTEASQIELADYTDPEGRFTMKIPKGWEVSTTVIPDMAFAIHAYKPEEDNSPKYHVYMQLKVELMLSEQMKAFEMNNFSAFPQYAILYDAAVNTDGTVAGMYRNFNDVMRYMTTYETGYDQLYQPVLNNFEVIEEYNYNSFLKDYAVDDKIVRATYTDVYDGSLQQGLFTGSVVLSPLGNGTYSIYNVNFVSAPDAEFPLYENILMQILASINFTDEFVSQVNANTEAAYQSAREIGSMLQATMDECNRAWEARNSTYDIISQKQSDATLGYERVTDTNTGYIYDAYNGFLDTASDNFQPVTDDMYLKPIDGYIEK